MQQRTLHLAGFTLITIFTALSIFQLLIALGFPFAKAAWGGQYEVLPPAMRLASIGAIFIFLFVSLAVLEKLGTITLFKRRKLVNRIIWVFGSYLFLNTVTNLLSRSWIERVVMTPVALVSAILCIIVARAQFPDE